MADELDAHKKKPSEVLPNRGTMTREEYRRRDAQPVQHSDADRQLP